MKYYKKIQLKDGRECIIRNCTVNDAKGVLADFIKTHEETDFLLSYPDECTMTEEKEAGYIAKKEESDNEVEVVAEIDGNIVGTAGLDSLGEKYKLKHRADFGISVEKKYWNLGIGTMLLKACLECAKKAGYEQVELQVVADNKTAVGMYEKAGFSEYGRNPRGFKSRTSGYQEVILMRKELQASCRP